MEIIFVFVSIVQSIGISLGIGCSTVAIISFFVAIADGEINPHERKMLGVVYVLLRVAMGLILVTTMLLGLIHISGAHNGTYLSPFMIGQWILIFVLFCNAFLMTKHLMPSKFGPAIQASSWYTLGVTFALVPLGLTHFSLFEFIVSYVAVIAFATAVINGAISYFKKHRQVTT